MIFLIFFLNFLTETKAGFMGSGFELEELKEFYDKAEFVMGGYLYTPRKRSDGMIYAEWRRKPSTSKNYMPVEPSVVYFGRLSKSESWPEFQELDPVVIFGKFQDYNNDPIVTELTNIDGKISIEKFMDAIKNTPDTPKPFTQPESIYNQDFYNPKPSTFNPSKDQNDKFYSDHGSPSSFYEDKYSDQNSNSKFNDQGYSGSKYEDEGFYRSKYNSDGYQGSKSNDDSFYHSRFTDSPKKIHHDGNDDEYPGSFSNGRFSSYNDRNSDSSNNFNKFDDKIKSQSFYSGDNNVFDKLDKYLEPNEKDIKNFENEDGKKYNPVKYGKDYDTYNTEKFSNGRYDSAESIKYNHYLDLKKSLDNSEITKKTPEYTSEESSSDFLDESSDTKLPDESSHIKSSDYSSDLSKRFAENAIPSNSFAKLKSDTKKGKSYSAENLSPLNQNNRDKIYDSQKSSKTADDSYKSSNYKKMHHKKNLAPKNAKNNKFETIKNWNENLIKNNQNIIENKEKLIDSRSSSKVSKFKSQA